MVHALLVHLDSRGFTAAPRFLGVDEAGREILTFHPGALLSDHPAASSDELLAVVATIVREFHDASANFVLPRARPRWEGCIDPAGGHAVLHGDLAPWNVVVDDERMTVIDWDDVWVGRVEWELAYVLHTFVPLWPDGLSDSDTARRIQVFADAYRLPRAELRTALDLVPTRCRTAGEANRVHAAMGDQPFIDFVAQGIDTYWLSSADHVADRLPVWRRALRI
jgi:Ser/Thr protein kinase RdoA (MazF antagonist)